MLCMEMESVLCSSTEKSVTHDVWMEREEGGVFILPASISDDMAG